jgi:hypothetical protein
VGTQTGGEAAEEAGKRTAARAGKSAAATKGKGKAPAPLPAPGTAASNKRKRGKAGSGGGGGEPRDDEERVEDNHALPPPRRTSRRLHGCGAGASARSCVLTGA